MTPVAYAWLSAFALFCAFDNARRNSFGWALLNLIASVIWALGLNTMIGSKP